MRAHVAPLLAVCLLAACRPAERTSTAWAGDTLTMNTWSVVAVDPKTGDVGVAMASCVRGTVADALGALVPGKGAGATQAGFVLDNRNRVFAALKEGVSAEEVIKRVTDTTVDRGLNGRQYGIITMKDGRVQTASFTGRGMLDGAARGAGRGTLDSAARGAGRGTLDSAARGAARGPARGYRYAGVKTGTTADGMVVSAQGNTLAAEAVVGDPVAAFLKDDPAGFNLLPDRLMRAIEAGAHAGGDVRCNNESTGVRQTAATAMIIAARGTDSAYAAERLGTSDQGTAKAPWLAIAYAPPRDSFENPLLELRKRYDAWRRGGMKRGDGGG